MKNLIIIFFAIYLTYSSASAQSDVSFTITTGEVSVFAFEQEPVFVNVSTNDIAIQKDGNKLLLLAQTVFESAVLIVEIESRFYKINLQWSANKNDIDYFADFRQNTLNDCLAPDDLESDEMRYVEGDKNILNSAVIARVNERIQQFKNSEISGTQIYANAGIVNGFEAKLIKGFVDDNHYYFRLRLRNKNSIIYDLNNVRITYQTKQKNNLFKSDGVYKIDVQPTYKSDLKSISSQSFEYYYLAIPLFALDHKGRLKITFSERNGMRDVHVNVHSNKINHLQYISENYNVSESVNKKN